MNEAESSQSLRIWQSKFNGDGFVFDYHMTWHHYFDQGYYGLTKVLMEDIRKLPDLDLNGYVACEVLNTYFPTGFPNELMARLLWDSSRDVEELAEHYF